MLLEIGLFQKTNKQTKKKKGKEKNQNCIIKVWAIPIPISTTQ